MNGPRYGSSHHQPKCVCVFSYFCSEVGGNYLCGREQKKHRERSEVGKISDQGPIIEQQATRGVGKSARSNWYWYWY